MAHHNDTDDTEPKRAEEGHHFEVRHFAEKHGISPDAARKLIDEFGHDHERLEAEVAKHKHG